MHHPGYRPIDNRRLHPKVLGQEQGRTPIYFSKVSKPVSLKIGLMMENGNGFVAVIPA